MDDGRYALTVNADRAFLESSSTVYPVTVDPSVTINSNIANVEDATLSAVNTTTNYGSITSVSLGGSLKGYIAMHFLGLFNSSPLNSITANQIKNAELHFSCASRSGTTLVYAAQYRPIRTSSARWAESDITYAANGVSYDASLQTSKSITSTGDNYITITNIVENWKSSTASLEEGLLLRLNSNTTSNSVNIYSDDMYEPSLRPFLTINYNDFTYFCQNNPSLSSVNFSTNNLDILFYKTDSGISQKSWLEKINNAGCVICSMAMILRNLEATTSSAKYDVRTNSSYILQSDPFTVTLANTLFPSITYLSADNIYIANTTQNPVLTYYSRIASAFGKSTTIYDLNGTDEDKANDIAYYLSLNPEGIAVSFKNSNNQTHTIVFTGTTYEIPDTYTTNITNSKTNLNNEKFIESSITSESIFNWEITLTNITASNKTSTYEALFTVSDPISTSNYSGNQVLFKNSYTASNYEFGDAYKLIIIN